MGSKLSRRNALQLMTTQAAALTVSRAFGERPFAKPAPNVIIVLLDDVGYGDFSCLGNPVIETPNMDKLHDRSVRFTDFHVSPTCSPTRAALMTGRYNNATGVWHTIMGRSLLDPKEVTMAECFRSSGYRTGIFGKWHLGDNYPSRPQDKGFEEVVVVGGGGIWQTPDFFGNDDFDGTYWHNGKFQKYPGYSTDVWFDQSMQFIETAKKENKPFFCYLATSAAHEPTWAKEKDTAPYVGVTGLKKPGFYGMITNADENMGRLVKFLDRHQLTDNTILILATDNGGADGVNVFNASMRGKKSSPYEGGHRVPCFVSWPLGNMKPDRDIPTLTAHIDILPTLVDLCGLHNHGKDVHGKSLRPLLQIASAAWPERTLFTDSQREEQLVKWRNTAVMTQRWRLVNVSKDNDPPKLELYEIRKDPGQQDDIAAANPDVVQSLSKEYDTWWGMVSARGDEFVRIVLGNDAENPAYLTSMDWHGDALEVWNQHQIRTAPVANGSWAVDIGRAGRYRFELRRWPREVDLPIGAAYVDARPNREKAPGVGVNAVKARIMLGNIDQTKSISPSDKFAEFAFDLPKGPAELRAIFYDESGTERGSYYLYAHRSIVSSQPT
jgi:arylsulfatase A-like enzyme